MSESFTGVPDHGAERVRQERAKETLRKWFESTPVFLASSSSVRRDRLVRTGFRADNVTMVSAPDSAEADVFRMSKADTVLMDECAKAKGESLDRIPGEAFVFAFDTLVGIYPDMINPEHPEALGSVMGETVRKPESDAAAKEFARKVFLTAMLNHLRFSAFERSADTATVDTEAYRSARVAATGIHAITGMQIRFPGSETLETYRDRIVAVPKRLLSIVDSISEASLENRVQDIRSLSVLATSAGKTVGEEVDTVIEEVFSLMRDEGVDPLRICGGVAYSLGSVRELLGVEEYADLFQDGDKSDVPDRTIYSGYPEKLLENVLRRRAGELSG